MNIYMNIYIFIYIFLGIYIHIYMPRKSPTIVNIVRMVCATLMYPGSKGEWVGMHMCE